MPYLFAINYLDTQQVFFLNINWQGEREGRREEEAFRREVQVLRRGAAVTLVRIGAVQFSKQRSYDLWEIRLHLVYSKIHRHSSEKLIDACSLKIHIRSVFLILVAIQIIIQETRSVWGKILLLQFWLQKFLGTWEDH